MTLKYELQNIISGNGTVRNGEIIQSITRFLRREKETIRGIEKTEFSKKQEGEILITFIESRKFWFEEVDFSRYIGEGAEQKIFEYSDPKFVLKLNDSFFYEYWEDYLNSLLLHNFFFPHLAYELLGFYRSDGKLYSVVKQAFVRSTEATNLDNVKEFLSVNGFVNRKDNDFFNPDLGIILEDLHDENVLTEDGTLQFIDTVFFLMPTFYEV
jgi:hypothetical protein